MPSCGEQRPRNCCTQVLSSVKRKQRVPQGFEAGTLPCVSEADPEVSRPGSKESRPAAGTPGEATLRWERLTEPRLVCQCRFDPEKGQVYFKKKRKGKQSAKSSSLGREYSMREENWNGD